MGTEEKSSVVWTLGEAIALVRELNASYERTGWHFGLTGGVLFKGESSKDVDIIAFPRDATKKNITDLRDYLKERGWRCRSDYQTTWEAWREQGGTDKKRVEIWKTANGRRVDIMILW